MSFEINNSQAKSEIPKKPILKDLSSGKFAAPK